MSRRTPKNVISRQADNWIRKLAAKGWEPLGNYGIYIRRNGAGVKAKAAGVPAFQVPGLSWEEALRNPLWVALKVAEKRAALACEERERERLEALEKEERRRKEQAAAEARRKNAEREVLQFLQEVYPQLSEEQIEAQREKLWKEYIQNHADTVMSQILDEKRGNKPFAKRPLQRSKDAKVALPDEAQLKEIAAKLDESHAVYSVLAERAASINVLLPSDPYALPDNAFRIMELLEKKLANLPLDELGQIAFPSSMRSARRLIEVIEVATALRRAISDAASVFQNEENDEKAREKKVREAHANFVESSKVKGFKLSAFRKMVESYVSEGKLPTLAEVSKLVS